MPGPVVEDDVVVPLDIQTVLGRPRGRRDRWGTLVAAGLIAFPVWP